jgi:hypothetical protein
MPDNTILCGRPKTDYCVTVGNYKSWDAETDNGWSKKPRFIRQRLFERYIDPVSALDLYKKTKEYKNGFYIMAVSCLLIETLVSFWRGWESTEPDRRRNLPGKSREAFSIFFQEQDQFSVFQKSSFYKDVRCGILHQGETKNGWIVARTGPLFNGTNRIDARRFHDLLAAAIRDYEYNLSNPPAGSLLRTTFDKKMKAVIRNCE